MAVNLSSLAGVAWQFFDNSGSPLSGGLLYTYEAGTTTPVATYTSISGLIAHSNPIVLDAAGRVPSGEVWLLNTYDYKFSVKTSVDVLIASYDNVSSTVNAANLSNTTNPAFGDALIGFRQSNNSGNLTDATGRTVHQKLQESVSVKDFGAVGDGIANDTAAFVAATALNAPIFVPQSSSFYAVTALTAAQQKLLYGVGVVKIAGVQTQISTAPYIDNDNASIRVVNQELQPSKWPSVDGSLYNGAVSVSVKRTGGFGSYGVDLVDYLISNSTPAGEFDVGMTSWVTNQNLAGGSVFGKWGGSNTPSSFLGQTYTGGSAIGQELNVGNRWADFGYQEDVGGIRYTVALQLIPDVLPAPDGETVDIYPGSFAQVIGPSVHGHRWWTGIKVRTDTIMPNGIVFNISGGSTIGDGGGLMKVTNNFVRGIDFSGATFSGQAILFGSSQSISWGGTAMNGTSTTFGLTTGTGTGEGGLFANNYAQQAMRWSSSGSAAKLGFFGASVIEKPVVTGSKGGNAALDSLLIQLANLGLITNSTS